MESSKVRQSKSIKNDGAIQFEPIKMLIFFIAFYSDLAGNLVRKLPLANNKFNNSSTKEQCMNREKSCHNVEQCNATLESIKKNFACLDASAASGLDEISSQCLKDGTKVVAFPLCNLVNFSIKQSSFPD